MALNSPLPNPERIHISTIETPATKFYGLCPYQYVNTIQGRMENRLNHHISFDKNKLDRSVNLNPIYYNRHKDLDMEFSQVLKYHSLYSAQEKKSESNIHLPLTLKEESFSPEMNLINSMTKIIQGKWHLLENQGKQWEGSRRWLEEKNPSWMKAYLWPMTPSLAYKRSNKVPKNTAFPKGWGRPSF